MREAHFSGTFYPKGELTLRKKIEECFEHKKGPGVLPAETQKGKTSPVPKGILVPHAAYDYSGPCAAWGYKAIGDAPLSDVYIIVAPSHKAQRTGLTQQTFTTPLGMVRVDQDFARRLVEKGHIEEDDYLHEEEHSIEVQLPFLQAMHYDVREKIKILPILVSPGTDFSELIVDIKEILVETGKSSVVICSTDFTHYGRDYHYAPFLRDIQENIAALDKGAIDFIKKFDVAGFEKYVDEKMATICGVEAISLFLRLIRSDDVRLEQYYTSAEITGEQKKSVSYAAMTFY